MASVFIDESRISNDQPTQAAVQSNYPEQKAATKAKSAPKEKAVPKPVQSTKKPAKPKTVVRMPC